MDFAGEVRAHFEADGGLSAVFAAGGTRTTYILAKNRHKANPGRIEDFTDHSTYLQGLYQKLIQSYFELGGQYLILTAFSFRGFTGRGKEYGQVLTNEIFKLANDQFRKFYLDHEITPSFVGIDTLMANPELNELGHALDEFQRNWPVPPTDRRLI